MLLYLVAQAAADASGDIIGINPERLLLQLIPNLGVLSILVWFMHYTVTHTIPNLNAENNQTMLSMAAENARAAAELSKMVTSLVEKFDLNLREERSLRQQELKEERSMRQAEIRELTQAIREIRKNEKGS